MSPGNQLGVVRAKTTEQASSYIYTSQAISCRHSVKTSSLQSPKWQASRKHFLNAIAARHGDKPYNLFERRHVRRERNKLNETPSQANKLLKHISALFNWAIEEELAEENPAFGVKRVKYNSPGFHTWTEQEILQYEQFHPIGTKARLAQALLLYTGVRISDAVNIGRQHIREGWLSFRIAKTGVNITIPVLPALQNIIDASPVGEMTLIVTEHGKPFTVDGFGNKMRKWCDLAGLDNCSSHGLRKAGATRAAENGATENQLMDIFGWLSPQEAQRYPKAARQKLLTGSAMHMLVEGHEENKSVPLLANVGQGGTIRGKKSNKINGGF